MPNVVKLGGGSAKFEGTATASQVLSGATFYSNDKEIKTGTMTNRGAVTQSLAINGTYTIPAGYHNGSGKVTQSITTLGAKTYTPTTSNQTIASGRYLSGTQTIKGDSNLVASNIKSGTSIFSVTGSYSGTFMHFIQNGTLSKSTASVSITVPSDYDMSKVCILANSDTLYTSDPPTSYKFSVSTSDNTITISHDNTASNTYDVYYYVVYVPSASKVNTYNVDLACSTKTVTTSGTPNTSFILTVPACYGATSLSNKIYKRSGTSLQFLTNFYGRHRICEVMF